MLRLSSEVTRFGLLLHTIYIYWVNNFNTIYVERLSFTPIWLASNILVSSVILNNLPAIILLSSFLIVLSSVIS